MLGGRDDTARRKGPVTLSAEIREAERKGYWKGVAEGERRAKKLLNCMCATNSHLLDLVRLLDTDYPIQGVTISFDLADQIIRGLRRPGPQRKLAAELKQIADQANRGIFPELRAIEDELLAAVS